MTSETYLDLTFDRATKGGKRPIRPKLLKLSDVSVPHRNRKKTKVKQAKDRSLSSVRDRIYDDPAYTDDISHLANPMRRSSCSGKSDIKAGSTPTGGSSSLGKRSKLTKEFLQYAKQGKARGLVGPATAYKHEDASSSSDDQIHTEAAAVAAAKSESMSRRGRSLERSMCEKSEKKREKRERTSKQKRNLSLDNNLQSQAEQATRKQIELEARNAERSVSALRSKDRKSQALPKQYSDGPSEVWNDQHLPPDHDELYSVRSSSKESTSAATKMQIGRRFLKGEIGIKSFNYYLLKEGLKSSKKFVEKQRHSLSGSSKKLHSRSEENIYEEIFFKDAPASDEEQQLKVTITQQQQPPQLPPHPLQQQQHGLVTVGTPLSQGGSLEEATIYPDCELCMQQCSDESCEYCIATQSAEMLGSQRGAGVRPYVGRQVSLQQNKPQKQQQQVHHNKQHHSKQQLVDHFGLDHVENSIRSGGAPFINQDATTMNGGSGATTSCDNNGMNMPAAHILEFQSYNPNNPGVYKIETTPVAITGEYNPILQFQQTSSSTTTTTTTPSEPHQHPQQSHHHHHQEQKQSQQYQQHKPLTLQQTQAYLLQSNLPLSTVTNHYQSSMGGGILPMLPQTGRQRGQRTPHNGQQQFFVSYNSAMSATGASAHRTNTKSSSSSDSLQHQQQLHKFNTMSRLEANVLMGDPFYGGGQMHPLMYAASRPIGGSQILVDPYEPPQMYKSDSKASILSEYSLRSSDNSHRYTRYRYGGRGEISDSSLGDSLFSYASAQRRYFGSSESCRFAFECRRCSLDGGGGGIGMGGGEGGGGGDKCSSDTCRYECRNCDCSSSYFSSDFDDVYGTIAGSTGAHRGSGIPRKTAAGTLPSSGTQPEGEEFDRQQEQLDLKQNKYAQDFFKHVNDVKRSIYQSEMQRNSSVETQKPEVQFGRTNHRERKHDTNSPLHFSTMQLPVVLCATLPLTKERTRTQSAARTAISTDTPPMPAPRTSLQQVSVQPATATAPPPPKPTQRRGSHVVERREYPSLDRLVASATGAIPKNQNTTNTIINLQSGIIVGKESNPSAGKKNSAAPSATTASGNNKKPSPHQSPKAIRITDRPLGLTAVEAEAKTTTTESRTRPDTQMDEMSSEQPKRERYLNVGGGGEATGKRHHRTTSSKSVSLTTRRRDIPAPPPPSPATYSDLQELKANLECAQDDTNAQKPRRKEAANPTKTEESHKLQQQSVAYIKATKDEKRKGDHNINSSTPATAAAPQGAAMETATKDKPSAELRKKVAEAAAVQGVAAVGGIECVIQQPQSTTNNEDTNAATTTSDKSKATAAEPQPPAPEKVSVGKAEAQTDTSSAANFDGDDDDVFYDARSEISAGPTTASAVARPVLVVPFTNSAVHQESPAAAERHQRRRRKDVQNLDEGHQKTPRQQEQKQQDKQQTPPQQKHQQQQQQQIANKTEHGHEEEKLLSTKDNDSSPKPNVEHERNETKPKPKKDKNGTKANVTVATVTADDNNDGGRNDNDDGDGKKFVADGMQSAVALNLLVEGATTMPAETTATIRIARATTTPTRHRDSTSNMAKTKEAKKHERRRSSRQHHKTTTLVTLSCDTCCQIESQQQQQKQKQQQHQQQQKSSEVRIKTKTSKERATKIKQETKVTKDITKRLEEKSTTITPTSTPISTPTTTTTTPTATCAVVLPSTEPDACHKYNTHVATTSTADKFQEIGAQNAAKAQVNETPADSEEQPSHNVAAACVHKTSLATTTMPATSTTPSVTSSTPPATSLAPAISTCVEAVAASVANTTGSCNSDIAGVATLVNSVSLISSLPIITTTQPLQQAPDIPSKRPPLHRQDYSCLDSSEAQSDDSHLTRDSVTRESQNDELSSSTHDKIDVSTLPLPALPPKKRRSRLRASPSKYHNRRHDSEPTAGDDLNALPAQVNASEAEHLSAFQQYVAKRRESLEASTRSFNEKLEARRMHYHMGGGSGGSGAGGSGATGSGMHMPTYLFGEHYYGLSSASSRKTVVAPATKQEIFLNKSGWVQVNTKQRSNDENRGYRRMSYAQQNGGDMQRNTIRVIQIDNTRRSDLARQALLKHQHSIADPNGCAAPRFTSSKVEELIQRNEARLSSGPSKIASRDPALRPGYRIVDPKLASILNERPGFLPVKNLNDADSPPPITPILSPPPAFQDTSKSKHFDRRKPISSRQQSLQQQQQQPHQQPKPLPTTTVTGLHANNGGKGMVFSRSFEYDARRPTPTNAYVETFSRSFDGNLSERPPPPPQRMRERSPNFSTLTGNSPNYLSKKDSGGGSSGSLRSRDSSPKYQQPQTTAYLNASVKEAPPSYSVASTIANKFSPRARHERSFERSKSHNVLGRSRKSQFSRAGSSGPIGASQAPLAVGMSRFRSFDTTIAQRLNSCDSGARSDLSNDELDNDDDEGGSTEFLTTTNYHHSTISPFKTQRQRSLTPDRNESHSSSSSIRKQRSLTPESRSLTPEDRRKKGSQVSLMGSRQNSSSRSNTLERKQRLDEKTANISRSSSSSSYSGREHDNHTHAAQIANSGVASSSAHRRSMGRSAKQTEEHRIRRSRSLQLSERSPNRSHKMIVCVGQPHAVPTQAPIYQQASTRSNINNGGHGNFPPSIRSTGKSQSILVNSNNGGGSTRIRNSDIDKSRSFDFDYCNYNSSGATPKGHNSASGSNQNVPMRLDFDKSRSFDDDYRETINSNNNLGASGMRYLQASESGSGGNGGNGGPGRLRRSSPVGSGSGGGGERSTRSPQSSGSSCNNLNVPRQSTSPQNYGTRLCDHELTYDMLRKSLDRSPIMDFRRGESADYELPQSVIRNRETINSGGNSELNFLNNDTRIYEHPTTTPTTTSSLKQQRSLGHSQSPSESQYSLERLHNSRDSITPDGASDYRSDYIYRQSHAQQQPQHHRESARSNTRGSQKITPTTTTTRTRTKSDAKQTTQASCSFWPHCGACHSHDSSVSVVKRQNSLQNPKTASSKCQRNARRAAPPAGETLLRRNHSAAQLNGKDFTRNGANVSTVSVNVNVIQLDNSMSIDDDDNDKVDNSFNERNRSQWTLLCSGVSPSSSSSSSSYVAPRTKSIKHSTPTDVKSHVVAPLVATSLVFLGDCEMPITRDRKNATEMVESQMRQGYERDQKNSRARRGHDHNRRNSLKHEATKTQFNNNNGSTTTSTMATTITITPTAAEIQSSRERSLSLPDIFQTMGFPRTTTTNDGISVIGIRNGFSANLTHQIRAVSSPSLTDDIQEASNRASADNSSAIPLQATSVASSTSDETVCMPPTTHAAIGPNASSVLQKFKRTLTNFNKNQTPSSGNDNAIGNSTAAPHPLAAPTISSSALALSSTVELSSHDITDSSSVKYRFGPLIWRSSKERRKTKYNRRDKCNSGDSGIQIELENDEHIGRVIATGGSLAARNLDEDEDSPKLRSVRRTNSAKATTISDQTSAAMSAKAKILKKMEICHEREAPESLPTRSLSQPNGLETFGISRADLDDSDSDSVASHDDGPNYYPIYAEVLYSFSAAGPQELGLERGSIIEILRKEVGPWWFGRIRKEDASLVEEILDPELGWFPKEFVRVIQSPENDSFFLTHMTQMQQGVMPPPPPPPSTATSMTSPPLQSMAPPPATHLVEAINAVAAVDQNNVTTIVIESPPAFNSNASECKALAPSRSINVIMENADILRRSAVKELLDTEVNYVKLLASICEGYLPAMSKRIDIFTPNSIRLIFSNISAIYKFQRKFLDALRKGIEQNQIAKVFLKMHKGFLCYSTYCNAYPRALIELESYDRIKDAKTILENCRESENLAELPLSAHLLAPVQRICRYPLHLNEIIKTAAKCTEAASANDLAQLEHMELSQLDIPDTREAIDMALEAMKSITEAVNEGKRHSETIARHQASFQNFKGPPLHLHSTRFFLQIDATRQKQNLWNSSCTLFLFDNQLIYCKRDIIKRSHFIYKGRIFLDRCRVINVRDGKMFGHTIKNSLRIYCEARDKWYDFSFRSANRKHRFLNTLALERQFGGKGLYVSEMTGFEYAFEERDYSDQSDYDMPDSEMRPREYVYEVGTSASGESSVPDSPAKSYKYSDTLPKKSQPRDPSEVIESHTGSLGRRRLGNWFRKPKSSSSTPNQSPTHKPAALESAVESEYTADVAHSAERVKDVSPGASS